MDPTRPMRDVPGRPSIAFPLLGVARAVLRSRSLVVHSKEVLQLRHNRMTIGAGNGVTVLHHTRQITICPASFVEILRGPGLIRMLISLTEAWTDRQALPPTLFY